MYLNLWQVYFLILVPNCSDTKVLICCRTVGLGNLKPQLLKLLNDCRLTVCFIPSETVMSFWWQQVECHSSAPRRHRQTGRWNKNQCCQNPGLVREREKWAWVEALASQQFILNKINLQQRVHPLPLHVSPLLCAKAIMDWSCSPQWHFACCGPLWFFYLLQMTRCSYSSPASLFSECRVLTVCYRFLFSFLSASSYSCTPVAVESSQSLVTDCFPLGLLGKS